jgi:hypothetical protein
MDKRHPVINLTFEGNHVMAGTRDGAMSILIGIAARKSIELKRPVKISEPTDLVPLAQRH